MNLTDLGNIYSSNDDFSTRAAILQSWYRASIKEKCGTGRKNIVIGRKEDGKPILKSIPNEYGHLVSGGRERNINFFFKETFEYALYRVEHKHKDETINFQRLFNNLLSSMPMAFNLFHPLMMIGQKFPEALNKMIKNAFPYLHVARVDEVLLEYIPTPVSDYTNDHSAMDAAIRFRDDQANYIISIETKYTDKLGSNKGKDIDSKLKFAKSLGIFTDEGINTIAKGCTQIYRNFLLTEKYRVVKGLKDSVSIIMAPENHPTTVPEISSFHKNLRSEYHYKLQKLSLEDFTDSLKEDCPDEFKSWLDWFCDRYLNFDKTEYLFKEFMKR